MQRTILAVVAASMLLGFHGRPVSHVARSSKAPGISQALAAPVDMSGPMVPPLRIVSPADGATVGNPLAVVVETPADLSAMTMTTHMREYSPPHLHIDLDKRVTMPALKHLTKIAERRYRYVFGTVAAGRHAIRVYWADAKTHKAMNLPQTVTVTVRSSR